MQAKYYWIAFLKAFLCLSTSYSQTFWQVKDARIEFRIKNFGSYVKGSLKGLEAKIYFSPESLSQSIIEATVKAETINTGNKTRDKHLRQEDYLYVAQFPLLRMRSKKVVQEGEHFVGYFDLTIRNKTQEVRMPFRFMPTSSGNEAIFTGNFSINRRDFDVGGKSWVLGEEVLVDIEVKAYKQ